MKDFGSTVKEIVTKQLGRAEDSHGRQAVVHFLR